MLLSNMIRNQKKGGATYKKQDQCRRQVIVNIRQESIIPVGEQSIKKFHNRARAMEQCMEQVLKIRVLWKDRNYTGESETLFHWCQRGRKSKKKKKGSSEKKAEEVLEELLSIGGCIAINAKGGDYWKNCYWWKRSRKEYHHKGREATNVERQKM